MMTPTALNIRTGVITVTWPDKDRLLLTLANGAGALTVELDRHDADWLIGQLHMPPPLGYCYAQHILEPPAASAAPTAYHALTGE